jgi:hypothetical protein
MLFCQLFDARSSTYTYLLATDYGKKAVIIAPVKSNYEVLMNHLNLPHPKLMDNGYSCQ